MRKHKDGLSNRTINSFNSSKYNKAIRVKPCPSIEKNYEIRPDGWRKKKVTV